MDLAPFAELSADPEVMRHFMGTYTRAEADGRAAKNRAHMAQHGFGPWAVELPGAAPFIGYVGLFRFIWPAPFTPNLELSWKLARPFWGSGYATEAARAVVAHAFGPLGFDEVVALTVPANTRSRRVMERLGMTRDPAEDFDHPRIPDGHALQRHVLYRLRRLLSDRAP